ncbi:MAG: DUF2169 domain-containing protein [Pseudomonadota bacterium]
MELLNQTAHVAAMVPMVGASGELNAVAILKATYSISPQGLLPASVQQDIAYSDITTGPPDAPKPVYDSDLVDRKPAIDLYVSRPSTDRLSERDGETIRIAVGAQRIEGRFHDQWSLGPLPRNHTDRVAHAGTYDEAWQRTRMPLPPVDFDVRYHQSARTEQTFESLDAETRIAIQGLYGAESVVSFALPDRAPVLAGAIAGVRSVRWLSLDTICISGVSPMVILTWRCALVCPRSFEDVAPHSLAMILRNRDALALVS